jgi:hypothetical protein
MYGEKEWALAAQILGGWWDLTMGALEETVGSEKAAELIRPHMEHSARAAYHVLKQRVGWEEDSVENVTKMMAMGHLLTGKRISSVRVKDDMIGEVEMTECPFAGSTRSACVAVCYHATRGASMEASGDCEGDLPKMMKNGDPVCVKSIRRKSSMGSDSDQEWKNLEVDVEWMPRAERDYFFRAYLGQFWLNAVDAFNDIAGEEATERTLAPAMRANGMSVGLGLVEESTRDGSIRSAMKVIDMIDNALTIESEYQAGETGISWCVVSCPFVDSIGPACGLFEAFIGGVVEAVSPSNELAVDRRMLERKIGCLRTLRKK